MCDASGRLEVESLAEGCGMSAHFVGLGRARARQQLGLSAVVLVLLLQVGCVTGAPLGRGMLGGTAYRRLTPAGFQAVSPREEPRASGSGGGAGEHPVSAEAVGRTWAREPEGGARHEEEAWERAWRVEEARAGALVQAAQGEGRDPRAAREAEVDRALARAVGLCGGVEEVGAVLAFTFWVEGGALTLVGYGEEGGGGSAGRPVDAEGLARVLRHVLTEYVGRRTGEVVLRLRREEGRWAVDYDATRQSPRPAEARTLPVRIQGTPADTFLAFHETARERLRAVQVPAGGARVRAELVPVHARGHPRPQVRERKTMEQPMALPGMDRLMDVCRRLELGLNTSPPAREPLKAGCLLEGFPSIRYWRVSMRASGTRYSPRG